MSSAIQSFITEGILSKELPIVEDIKEIKDFTETLEKEIENASKIDSRYVLDFKDSLSGQDYPSLLQRWEQWFFSSTPYQTQSGDVLFLRGNMENYSDPSSFLDMTSLSGNVQRIQYGKFVLVPAITAGFNIGEYFRGEKVRDEETLHTAVQDYVKKGGPYWCSIQFLNDNVVHTVPVRYVETPLFQLHVAPENPFRKLIDPQQESGDFFTVCSGYIVVLKDLPEGKYRIRFGGIGRHNYRTDAVWDIEVVGSRKEMGIVNPEPPNISKKRHPSQVLAIKYLSTNKK
jgi:hypothetical protein